MYKGGRLTICDRLTQIKESIYYIQQWSKEINCADDFLASMDKVMVFNACVMRLQVIGEQVGKLSKKVCKWFEENKDKGKE